MDEQTTTTPMLLRWRSVYREAELYKSAVRVYTKPLFQWRKALKVSSDGKNLYELAGRGLRGLDAIHRELQNEEFHFRPSIGLTYNFNGKRRKLYIPPWEERIVDLLIYRILNQRLHRWFSSNSYAYRDRTYGLDGCQSRIAAVLRSSSRPWFVVKRDVADYFASVNHGILLCQLREHLDGQDYLFELLRQRIEFEYQDETGSHRATVGIPFGCASACVCANIYLTQLDRAIERIPRIHYFRYADDILLLSPEREAAEHAAAEISRVLKDLQLSTKASHESQFVIHAGALQDPWFKSVGEFRHLGLSFRAAGAVALSRDKRRKIENLFRFSFRRSRRRWRKLLDPEERARTLAAVASDVVENGVRNVAILDYYLKHVTDIEQLRSLDRWLAEEVLSLVFGGHKKGHFAKLSFAKLRQLGLPCLVHRWRLIHHGQVQSPFFIWQQQKAARAFRGTVASLVRNVSSSQTSLRSQKQQPT